MSKIAMIYHSVDLDGYMSAAIVKHWFVKNLDGREGHEINSNITPNVNVKDIDKHLIHFIGYNYNQPIPDLSDYNQPIPDLSDYNQIIMCDISFPLQDMKHIAIDILDSNNTNKFIWLDHHKSAIETMYGFMWNYSYIKGLQDTKFAACELTWKYFFPNETMPEIVRLLGRYDCFGHKGTDEEQYVLEFQYGARQCINNYDLAHTYLMQNLVDNSIIASIHDSGVAIYSYLCSEAKYVYSTKFDLIINGFKFAAINKNRFNPVNFGIDYHADGYDGVACFWYEGDALHCSLYNDNGEVDVSTIAKQYGVGGHRGAAGFILKSTHPLTTFTMIDIS